jgi:hypothetical protein
MCTNDSSNVGTLTSCNAAAISDVGEVKGCPAYRLRIGCDPFVDTITLLDVS